LDPAGHTVASGAAGEGPWLHYIARKASVAGA
jgi:hypothetical protein